LVKINNLHLPSVNISSVYNKIASAISIGFIFISLQTILIFLFYQALEKHLFFVFSLSVFFGGALGLVSALATISENSSGLNFNFVLSIFSKIVPFTLFGFNFIQFNDFIGSFLFIFFGFTVTGAPATPGAIGYLLWEALIALDIFENQKKIYISEEYSIIRVI